MFFLKFYRFFIVLFFFLTTASCSPGKKTQDGLLSDSPLVGSVDGFSILSAQVSSGLIFLNWTSDSGATAFNVEYGTAPQTYSQTVFNCTSNTLTSCAIAGLNDGTDYYFRVTAVGTGSVTSSSPDLFDEVGPVSMVSSFHIQTAVPTVNGVRLSWTASAGATSYLVSYGTTSGSYPLLATSNAGIQSTSLQLTGLTQHQSYYFMVQAVNAFSNRFATAEMSAIPITAPTPPLLLNGNILGPQSSSLQWSVPSQTSGTMTYQVYRSLTSGDSNALPVSLPLSGVSFSDTSMLSGVPYYYVVRASNEAGQGPPSNEISLTSLSSFSIQSLSFSGPQSLILNWGQAQGASNYQVEYSTTALGDFSQIVPVNSGVFTQTLTGLTPGVSYSFRVRANGNNTSLLSQVVNGTPLGNFSISSLALVSSGVVQVNWLPSAGASQYLVSYGTASGSYQLGSVVVPQAAPMSTQISNLSPGQTYYIMVSALNGTATGSVNAAQEKIITLGSAPATPSGVSVTSQNGTVQLNWSASSSNGGGSVQYQVSRATQSNGPYQLVGSLSSTSFSETPLVDGTTYFYQIQATNVQGTSAASNPVNIQPIGPFLINSPSIDDTVGGDALKLTWNTAVGATHYNVNQATSNTGPYLLSNASTNFPTVTSQAVITSLTGGIPTYFQVVALNSTGAIATGTSLGGASFVFGTPIAPFSLSSATSGGVGSTVLSWSSAPGTSSYQVKYGNASGTYPSVGGSAVAYPANSTTVTGLNAGSNNYFRVTASNAYGNLDSLNEVTATPLGFPSAPSGLVAQAGTGSVQLSWSASTGGGTLSYTILRGEAAGLEVPLFAGTTLGHTYTDTSVVSGTTYYYMVQASNAAGTSPVSNEVSALPLSTVQINNITLTGAGALQVNWGGVGGGAVPGATTYVLQYGPNGIFSTNLPATSSLSASLNGLNPGTSYSFRVVASNNIGLGASTSSLVVTAVPIGNFNLSSVTQTAFGTVQVDWSAAPGASQYVITTDQGTSQTVYASPILLNNLSVGTTYVVTVVAQNSTVLGSLTASGAPQSVTITTVPSAPSGLVVSGSNGSVNLTWNAATSATPMTYSVVRTLMAAGDPQPVVVSGLSSLNYTDTSVTSGTTYYYQVYANNLAGQSVGSNQASIRPVGSFTLNSMALSGPLGLSVSWTNSAGASSYLVQYGTTSSGTFSNQVTVSSGLSTTILLPQGGVNYSFQVVASNTVGAGSSYTSNTSIGSAVGAFSVTGVTQAASGSAQVNWSTAQGASQYLVSYGTGGTYTLGSVNVPYAAGQSTLVSNLIGGTTYDFLVSALSSNASGSVPASPAGSLALYSVPSVPSGVTVTSAEGAVNLSWSAVTGGGTITYNIYRATAVGGPYTQVGVVPSALTFNDTPAVNGSTYFYQVTASNIQGTSAASTAVSILPIGAFTLGIPTISNAIGGSSLGLSWTGAIGATSYTVTQASSSSGPYTALTSTPAMPTSLTAATVSGLTPGSTTYLKVVATNSTGATATGNNATTGYSSGVPLSTFSITSATSGGTNATTLNWGPSTGANIYQAKYGSTSGSYPTSFNPSVNAPTTSQTVTGLASGSNNYFRVTASNGYGSLDSANEVTVTPLGVPSAPTGLTAIATASGVTLNWSASSGGGTITYNVLRSNSSGTEVVLAGSSTTGTSFLDLNVVSGTTYYYVVQATNAAGSSGSSNEVSVQPVGIVSISAVSINAAGSLLISWGAPGGGSVAGATSYMLYYGPGFSSSVNAGASLSASVGSLTPGTLYSFKVVASNAVGVGASSTSSIVSGTPVGGFTMSSVTQTGLGTVQVSWNASAGASAYLLSSSLGTQTISSSPQTIPGLTTGTGYTFTVAAQSSGTSGSLTASNAPLSVTPYGVPTAPISLAATGSNGAVTLTWTASTVTGGSAPTYTLVRTSGGTSISFSNISTTTYTDSTVVSGVNYSYLVYASNLAGNSANSNTVSLIPIAPFSVTSVLANNTTGPNALAISWPSVTGATQYTLYQSSSVLGPWTAVVTNTASTSYTVTGLTAATNPVVYFYVMATNASVNNASTSAIVSGIPLGSFSLSAPTSSAVGSVSLSWGTASNATSYQVKYGLVSGSYPYVATATTNTSQTITGLTGGTLYYFQVTAFNGSGNFSSQLDSTAEVNITPLKNFTYSWVFSSSLNTTLSNSSYLTINGGYAQLTAGDQTDSTTATFNQRVSSSSVNLGGNQVVLKTTGGVNNGTLAAYWTPYYNGINMTGYWPMDTVSNGAGGLPGYNLSFGTTAGTVYLGSGSGLVTGQVNSGFYFNGNTSVWIPSTNDAGSSSGYAVSIWFKTSNNNQAFFSSPAFQDNTSNWSIKNLFLDIQGNVCGFIGTYDGSIKGETVCSSGSTSTGIAGSKNYADGNWHHVVHTYRYYSGVYNQRLYVDGVLKMTGVLVAGLPWFGSHPVPAGFELGYGTTIAGGDPTTSANAYYTGSLDELAIWKTILLDGDVKAIYARQKNQKYNGTFVSRVFDSLISGATWTGLNWVTSLPFGKPLMTSGAESGYGSAVTNFSSGLSAYWKFDDSYGSTTAVDSTTSANTAAVNGNIQFGGMGVLGNSAAFSPASSGYFSVSSSTSLSLTGAFTLAGWFYLPSGSYPNGVFLMNKTGSSTNKGVAGPFDFYLIPTTLVPRLALGNGSSSAMNSDATSAPPFDQWFHVAVTVSATGSVTHYLNGVQNGATVLNTATLGDVGNPVYLGSRSDSLGTVWFSGLMDEVAVWKGVPLSAASVQQLYQRGANKVFFQLRSCSTNNCSDDASGANWKGLSANVYSYLSETTSPTTTPPSLSASGISNNQYAQYQTIFESIDATLLPSIQSVNLNPNHYSNTQPYLTVTVGPIFSTLSNFSQTIGSCAGGVTYQLSLDGTNWKYWSGSAWGNASGYAQSNNATVINTNIGTFSAAPGTLYVRAFLNSSGTQACQLGQITVTGAQ